MTPGYRYTTVSTHTHTHTSTINHIFYLPLFLYTHTLLYTHHFFKANLPCSMFPSLTSSLHPSCHSSISPLPFFFMSVGESRTLASRLPVFLFIFPFDLLLCIPAVSPRRSLFHYVLSIPHPLTLFSLFLFFPLLFYSSSSSSRPLCLTLPLISEQTAGFDERNVNVRSCFCRGKWASERT